MQPEHLRFQLNEAKIHLEETLARLNETASEECGEVSLAVNLGHILDHICIAWHTRNMSFDEASAMTQQDFERLINEVPNFGLERVISDCVAF